jgi:hypothetical protein
MICPRCSAAERSVDPHGYETTFACGTVLCQMDGKVTVSKICARLTEAGVARDLGSENGN